MYYNNNIVEEEKNIAILNQSFYILLKFILIRIITKATYCNSQENQLENNSKTNIETVKSKRLKQYTIYQKQRQHLEQRNKKNISTLKINSKMADINSNMSLITLDINILNAPTKNWRLTD